MIPFLDLHAINERHRPEIDRAIAAVLDSGWYIRGRYNEIFCQQFASFCESRFALGVGNGLDALSLLIRAYGFGPGDEIIVPANTFIATVLAITHNGCTPVLVEPDKTSYTIDPAQIERHISPRTKAIIPVHLYGRVCEMDPIMDLAEKYRMVVLEDAAQAHGARYKGRRVGSLGHAAAFSFYPGKNLGCLGDGGAITTDDAMLYTKLKALANYGSHTKYIHQYIGFNSRLDELQAAVLSIRLAHLDADNTKRQAIAAAYLRGMGNPLVVLPECPTPGSHVWHLFVVRVAQREHFMQHMQTMGIQCQRHYPVAPHQQEAYKHLAHHCLPITEQIHKEVVSLPMSPVLKEWQVNKVIEAVNAYTSTPCSSL